MKKAYWAVVHKEDGKVWCQFLDIPNCVVLGQDDNVETLMETASLVCNDLFECEMERGKWLPPEPCSWEKAKRAAKGNPLVAISVEIPAPSVRINISIPGDKLALIDKAAKRQRTSRSALLVDSTLAAIR